LPARATLVGKKIYNIIITIIGNIHVWRELTINYIQIPKFIPLILGVVIKKKIEKPIHM
jgi:hypothetical protein